MFALHYGTNKTTNMAFIKPITTLMHKNLLKIFTHQFHVLSKIKKLSVQWLFLSFQLLFQCIKKKTYIRHTVHKLMLVVPPLGFKRRLTLMFAFLI